MHWRNIAPFCRDDGPQTGPMIHLPATWRHSGPTKVSITESHGEARREPLKFTPESFCRTKLCACPSAFAGTNEESIAHDIRRQVSPQHSLLLFWKIARVRRPLPLSGRHQGAIRTHQIELLADGDIAGAFQTAGPAPVRISVSAAPIGLVDGPGPRQRAIEYG